MAQTKRKRRSKHRGNAAGTDRGARAHGPQAEPGASRRRPIARAPARERLAQPPTWNKAIIRAAAASVLLFVLTQIGLFQDDVPPSQAIVICLLAMLIYIPLGYMFDSWMYKRFNKPKE